MHRKSTQKWDGDGKLELWEMTVCSMLSTDCAMYLTPPGDTNSLRGK